MVGDRAAATGGRRPGADGRLRAIVPGRGLSLVFRYDVIRIWLEPPEKFLTAGLSVLPLAPVSNVAPDQLEAVVRAVAERLKREADLPVDDDALDGNDGLDRLASQARAGEGHDRRSQRDGLGHSWH